MASGNLFTRLIITARDDASKVIGSLTKSVSKLSAGIAAVAAAATTWIGVKLFGESIDAAEQLETQMGAIRGAIEATGGAAGFTADELDAMARRLDEATLGSAAGFRDATVKLLTFKSVAGETFERTLMLSQDLAQAGFGSVESASVKLGKALEDPIKGLGALSKIGVTFTDSQKEMIKSFMAAGDQAKAQGVILDAVAGQVGGLASTMGSGLSGAIDLVGKRFTDLKEQLGAAMVPALTSVNNKLAELYGKLTDSGAVTKFGAAIADGFQRAFDSGVKFVEGVDWGGLLGKIQGFASDAGQTLDGFIGKLDGLRNITSTTLTGAGVAWDTFRSATQTAASWVVKSVEVVLVGYSKLQDAVTWLGLASEETAAKVRASAQDMGALYDQIASDAEASWARVGAGMDKLSGQAETAGTAAATLTSTYADQAAKLQALIYAEEAQTVAFAKQAAATTDAAGEIVVALDAARAEYERLIQAGDAQGAASMLQTIEGLKADLRALQGTAEAASAEVIAAFKRMGVQTQDQLQQVAAQAQADFALISESGQAAPAQIETAFEKYAEASIAANGGVVSSALQAAAAQQGLSVAVDEAGAAIIASATDGASAQQQLADAQQQTSDAVEQVGEAAVQTGDSLQTMGEQGQAASEATGGAALAMEKIYQGVIAGISESNDLVAAKIDGIVQSLGSWNDKISQIRELSGADFVNSGEFADAQREIDAISARAEEARAASVSLQQQMTKAFNYFGEFYKGLGAMKEVEAEALAAEAAMLRMELQSEKLGSAVSDLADRFDDGDLGLSAYLAKLERLRGQYASLGDEELDALDDKIRDVTDALADQASSAIDGLDAWRAKLNGIYGQEVEIQQLNWQQDRLETELALSEARRNGNAEEIAALTQQLQLIDEYYQYQVKVAAAQEAQDAIDAADAAAAEAERRASLTQAERDYEDALAALEASLSAAILNNDDALQQSILDQIAGEKQRHEEVIKNLDAEQAKRAEVNATGAEASTASAATTTSPSASGMQVTKTIRLMLAVDAQDIAEVFATSDAAVNAVIDALERAGLTAST